MASSNERIAKLLVQPYHRIIRADDDGFSAEVLEWPGCFSSGLTAAEAAANLEDAMHVWAESELEMGHDIPEPVAPEQYGGRIQLRVSPSQHRRAALQAQLEDTSLNRLVAAALSSYLGGADASRLLSSWFETFREDLRETVSDAVQETLPIHLPAFRDDVFPPKAGISPTFRMPARAGLSRE